ncbi:hypothetical protein QZH41_013825, partial [Actinostola sp. cb2023]
KSTLQNLKMPERCVVHGCGKRFRRWIKFVKMKRAKWSPTKTSVICSDHFNSNDFQRIYLVDIPNSRAAKPCLKKDDIGINVFPTIYKRRQDVESSSRNQRQANRMLRRIQRGESSVLSTIVNDTPVDNETNDNSKEQAATNAPITISNFEAERNECGSSTAMEYMAFDRAMTFLLGRGLSISTLISDRHTSIVKHMREKMTRIIHYFNLWHIKKKITKTLTKLSQESGCDVVAKWTKACGNHFYWSTCSTHDGNGDVIWAKFCVFLSHIINKHDKLQNPIFNKCQHGPDFTARQWLLEDSVVYDKLRKALTKPNLQKAIKKASPIAQTSCLEGLHSVLNQFAPKMIHYSFFGMYCRFVLYSILHFNSNLHRYIKLKNDGSQQVKVVFPKFKNGEGTVRDIRVKPNFAYVEEIFQTLQEGIQEKTRLDNAIQELTAMTPAHMDSMLEKQPKEDAIHKRQQRHKLQTKDVPSTTPVTAVQMESAAVSAPKAKPHCTVCKNPMKGHNKIVDCPKNRLLQDNS